VNTITTLRVADIRIDGGTQSRAEFDDSVMTEYADAITAGATMPPITVFFDGSDYWLADGFHRLLAYLHIGALGIEATVVSGSSRDAILFSVGANASHGMRRTNEDKHRAVSILLADSEWSTWSAREIAKRCCVSHDFVARLKASLSSDDSDGEVAYKTKHGTDAVMNTANIGRSPVGCSPDTVAGDVIENSRIDVTEQSSTPIVADPSGDEDEILAEMNGLRDQVNALSREIDSLTQTDLGAEIHKLSQMVTNLERREADAAEKLKLQGKQLKWFGARFADLRKLLNVKNDRDVVTAVNLIKVSK